MVWGKREGFARGAMIMSKSQNLLDQSANLVILMREGRKSRV